MKTLTAPNCNFDYLNPAPLNTNLVLLTHDNKVVTGPWKGPALPARNGQYKAWAGQPARDKLLESQLELM